MSSSVKDYYQRNTGLFLRLGGGRSTGSIHRPLWGERVESLEQALRYAYELVEEHIHALREQRAQRDGDTTWRSDKADESVLRVLDLGCGVGGALHYLAGVFGDRIEATGVTISPDQARRAAEGAHRAELDTICRFTVGDFHALPDMPPVDLAFSIEAYVQARDPEQYFNEAHRILRSGGRLVIIDDFKSETADESQEPNGNRRILERFEQGWHAGAFGTASRAKHLAESSGFRIIEDEDLTPLLKLGRPRDHFISLVVTPLRRFALRHPYGRSLVGGDALQKGLKRGLIEYRKIVFEKR